jgi:hypothetical protein
MKRMLSGGLIGAALTILLVSVNGVSRSANAQDAGSVSNATQQEYVGAVREAMLSPLLKTINETASTDSGKFLEKLVNEYGLDKLPPGDQQGAGLADIVPDFKSINEKAITLPLTEAGKNIHDADIAAFYYDFLQRSGFNISQSLGEKP